MAMTCSHFRHRYHNLEEHIEISHEKEKYSESQLCKRCLPEQSFPSFAELLRHARSYHTKKVAAAAATAAAPATANSKSRSTSNNSSIARSGSNPHHPQQQLCENCGKTVALSTMARHKSECRSKNSSNKLSNDGGGVRGMEEEDDGDGDGTGEGGPVGESSSNGRSKKYIPEKLTGIKRFFLLAL